MRGKPFVIFWGATVAAVLFLGAIWGTAARLSSPGRRPADAMVAGLAGLGLVGSLFVAGRIVIVLGRVQRRDRSKRSRHAQTASHRTPEGFTTGSVGPRGRAR
jgi:hypothetical protein